MKFNKKIALLEVRLFKISIFFRFLFHQQFLDLAG